MGLVAAKCTQCGANIEVDDTKEAGICNFCGTAFITEKAITNYNTYITNNNNFYGANVTIQNNENIDGLLHLAKSELQAKHYGADDLFKYLDDIVIKSPAGTKRIIELFEEMGLYKLAEMAINEDSSLDEGDEIAELLIKYDSDNIIGWVMKWKFGIMPIPDINVGENIIRLAQDSEKERYEKEVYSCFAENGPRCDAYKKYLEAIPSTYIKNNKYIQDLLIEQANTLVCFDQEKKSIRIEYIKSILPSDRVNEIKTEQQTTTSRSGCYIATCVYGSYDCPQVWTLRRFRDNILDVTWYGRLFIKCYYVISPVLVNWFGRAKWFRSFWKSILDKMVTSMNNKGVDNTYYRDKY